MGAYLFHICIHLITVVGVNCRVFKETISSRARNLQLYIFTFFFFFLHFMKKKNFIIEYSDIRFGERCGGGGSFFSTSFSSLTFFLIHFFKFRWRVGKYLYPTPPLNTPLFICENVKNSRTFSILTITLQNEYKHT